jgi:hypothetical protein
MDTDLVGRQGRGTEDRRTRQRQHDRAGAKKNVLKPHLNDQWVILPDGNAALIDEIAAWEATRNKHHAKAGWQFTPADARVKLNRLYPSL